VLLAAIALTVSLVLGAAGPSLLSAQTASSRSQLPATQPGLSRNEGVFLVTAADDGSRLVYFIAQNTRHSTLPGDVQLEQQLNSLWPVRPATRDEVLAFAEAAPVGSARTGLLTGPVVAESDPVAEAPAADEAPVAVSMPTASDPALYVLRPGDNLTRLSARFSTSIPAILAANGLTNANRIYVGQALLIPGLASTAEENQAAPMTVAPAAPMPVAADEPEPVADAPASPDALTYTVKAGDSAIHIARQFGVDVDALLAANGVPNRNRVYIGQVLDIPGA
jgi:LysM repeat protein